MTETEFHSPQWLNLDWSDWMPLNAGSFTTVPKEPGIYRIRHQKEERDFLEYIGESGDTRRRIQSLARGTFADEMPYRDPHTAAPCLWAVRDAVGSELEVSYTTPDYADSEQDRKGTEEALIALHRRETRRSPTANFGRMLDGYKQSCYSYNDPAYKGGPLDSDEVEPNCVSGIEPPEWQNWKKTTSPTWMGLNWSEPYELQERLDANPPKNGLYRIWYEDCPDGPALAYIGESSNIASRLYNHEQTFGEDAYFTYAEGVHLDAPHKRSEVETDLIGAHYLAENDVPLAQFGYEERLP